MLAAGGRCYRADATYSLGSLYCGLTAVQARVGLASVCQACAAPRKDEICQALMSKEVNAPAIARGDKEAPVAPPARPLVTAKDIYEVPRLAVQGMLAWSLPELAWWPLSRLFGQVNAATHPERNAQRDRGRRDSSSRHAANDRPAPRCRRKLGQSLRGALPLSARLAPRRLGAGNRHPWRRTGQGGLGQGARHYLLGRQFQLQRPHRQDRVAAPWTRGQSFQPPDPRLLHDALRRPLSQRGAPRHRGSLSRRAAHGRGA